MPPWCLVKRAGRDYVSVIRTGFKAHEERLIENHRTVEDFPRDNAQLVVRIGFIRLIQILKLSAV